MQGATNSALCLLFLEVEGELKPIGGQINHTDTLTTSLIDITHKGHQGKRTFLEGEGKQERDIEVELRYSSDAIFKHLRQMALNRIIGDFEVRRGVSGVNDKVRLMVTGCEDTSTDNSPCTCKLTLASTDSFEFNSVVVPQLPLITIQPWDRTINKGMSLKLISEAKNWDRCQWYFQRHLPGSDPSLGFVAIDGQTKPNLTFMPESARQWTGNYKVEYCNDVGCVESKIVYVEIIYTPALISSLYPLYNEDTVNTPRLKVDYIVEGWQPKEQVKTPLASISKIKLNTIVINIDDQREEVGNVPKAAIKSISMETFDPRKYAINSEDIGGVPKAVIKSIKATTVVVSSNEHEEVSGVPKAVIKSIKLETQ